MCATFSSSITPTIDSLYCSFTHIGSYSFLFFSFSRYAIVFVLPRAFPQRQAQWKKVSRFWCKLYVDNVAEIIENETSLNATDMP